jgi:uncharacterized protein (TIGR00297 family)
MEVIESESWIPGVGFLGRLPLVLTPVVPDMNADLDRKKSSLSAFNYLAALAGTPPADRYQKLWQFAVLSLTFALLGRVVRGVSTGGAFAGALVCFILLAAGGMSAFTALVSVFLLTWASTRIGYDRKQSLGTAEARTGRDAFQVLANLGAAAVCATLFLTIWPSRRLLIAMAAALAEAAADTVSSEIGQAFQEPRLITTWEKVAPGTDGAVSVAGTLAGITAAAAVSSVFVMVGASGRHFLVIWAASVAGMVADSWLGATLERRRMLGNNAVNFLSTVISSVAAFLLS